MTGRWSKQSLSFRQALVSVATAFVIGAILTLAQVFYDLGKEKEHLEQNILQVMSTLKQPAAQALYTVDRRLAETVIEGLFEYKTVYQARLVDDFGEVYAERRRSVPPGMLRNLFLKLSGSRTEFSIPLNDTKLGRPVGHMDVSLDTYEEMFAFFDRAVVVFVSGMLRNFALAICLVVVFNMTLVRPLLKLIHDISSRLPESGGPPLRVPDGHRESELGVLADSANRLLQQYETALSAQRQAERALREHQEGLEQTIAERTEELAYLASHDTLTGLPNRSVFSAQLATALAHAKRHETMVAIFFMDLDGFKAINDAHGHEAGDQVLVEVGKRLMEAVREEDLVARMGGDEFTLLLTSLKRKEDAIAVADKLIEQVGRPILGNGERRIGISIGIAFYPEDGDAADRLLSLADNLMYAAKKKGKGQYALAKDGEARQAEG